MATNFVWYRTFSPGAEVSQDPLDRFSQSLHHMVGTELQMINPTFFRYLKGRCHGNQFGKITYPPCTYRFGIEKWNGITPCILRVRTGHEKRIGPSTRFYVHNFGRPRTPFDLPGGRARTGAYFSITPLVLSPANAVYFTKFS